ncbi:MAG: Lrp/AsnC family transcriptional regulator [Candidatus Micrarchaeota archaeon]|nr:Lrp/AsnC family transcriptional regulator [Candidatus Micrarchaeota archaeon]MDE1847858.1 Lrp/AsnC family transcriptional regulator [Candidatus Micrarchaeota archaeon]MDE1864185.1 Lrp/AsnC family transcriptional regulator [Candidatus Micrarchaeota archaeon]
MKQIDYEFRSDFNERYSLVSRRILRMLSEDSRSSISGISRSLGLSRQSVVERVQKMEKELGIGYTLELNEDALGFLDPHLILVRFSSRPDYKYIKEIFSGSYVPQLVASLRGGREMIIYANAVSRQEYVHWDKSMQILLADYGVSWQASEVAHRQLGFFPLRNELLERLNLPIKYKEMIKILNTNSRASFQELSRQLGMHFNTVAYNFKKLEGMNYIRRFTTVMKPPENVWFMSTFGKYVISRSFEEDAAMSRKAFQADDENSLVSRYILVSQLVGSFDFFSIGAFDNLDQAYRNGVRYYKKCMANEKPKVTYGAIEEVLVGNLPIRSLDTRKVYNTIKWTPTR